MDKRKLIEEQYNKFISLTYYEGRINSYHSITGMVKHLCNDFFIFNLNNLPNGKELKIYYNNVMEVKEPELI